MAKVNRDYTKMLADSIMQTKENLFHQLWMDEVSKLNILPLNRIEMPRRGRYQVWQGHKMVADRIKHRKEALAVMKLLKENDDGTA